MDNGPAGEPISFRLDAMSDVRADTGSLGAAAEVLGRTRSRVADTAAVVSSVDTGHPLLADAVHALVETVHRNGRGLANHLDLTVLALRLAASRYEVAERGAMR